MDRSFLYSTEEVYNSVIDDTIQNCAHLQNSRVLEELKMLWKDALLERLKVGGDRSEAAATNFSSARNVKIESSDFNEFGNNQTSDKSSTITQATESVREPFHRGQHKESKFNQNENIEDDEFSDAEVDVSLVESKDLGPNPEGSNESDISDLDDFEPETRDLIVAQFEKVLRPTGKKTLSSNRWKIILRHGVLQINGNEILFDKMSGDFNFY